MDCVGEAGALVYNDRRIDMIPLGEPGCLHMQFLSSLHFQVCGALGYTPVVAPNCWKAMLWISEYNVRIEITIPTSLLDVLLGLMSHITRANDKDGRPFKS
jgi:hypothetical protein